MENTNQQSNNIDKHEGEYLLSLVEEFGFNPKYKDWVWGRIEVDIYTKFMRLMKLISVFRIEARNG